MARVVLKDPNAPSLKKTMKPPSLKYKTYFYRMVFINIIQTISTLYAMNYEQVNSALLPFLNKIKQLTEIL